MILNIYDINTEFLVASVHLNVQLSNRILKEASLETWDGIGEYNIDDLVEDHVITLNFMYLDPYHFSYTLEKTEEEINA